MAEFQTLMAVDALGRAMPSPSSCPRRADRKIGLFYFLWCGEHGRHAPRDISKILAADRHAGEHPESPVWGEIGSYHHWGEPLYGYYYSDDEWVIRRHMKLLCEAGVDFLFFDTTNAVTYTHNAKTVMRVLQEYHDAGLRVPQVMFYTNTASGQTAQELYESIYRPGYCRDIWFCLDGKPVIVAIEEACSKEVRQFFSIQTSQWPNEPDKIGGWPWMDFTRPQRVFPGRAGMPSVINVSVAQHPQLRFGDSAMYGETGNCGRAYHNGANDPAPLAWTRGYNFQEQFDRAAESDAQIILVTGWNEWIAGRWEGTPERPIMFVDCADAAYSRDIEMMRGGYGDNYYMQLAENIRRIKGCEPIPLTPPGKRVTFAGFPDGAMPRDHEGYGTIYQNHTTRNALRSLTLSHDSTSLTAVLTAAAPLSADRRGSFMSLYLGLPDREGFAFEVAPQEDGASATVYALDAAFSRRSIGSASLAIGQSEVTLTMDRHLLGLDTEDFTVWCKAADSTEKYACITDFYEKGDAAPLGRLCYVYHGTDHETNEEKTRCIE